MNGTLLCLRYGVISGPHGNVGIRTKIDGKNEKLPFESGYLKEPPKEVLEFLIKDYLVTGYLDIDPTAKHDPRFGDISTTSLFNYKKHSIWNFGFSIQHSGLEGVAIKNSVYKNIDLSFLPKEKKNEDETPGDRIKELVKTYLVRTDICHWIRLFGESYEKIYTENYFKERKKEKDDLKERQFEQIVDYARIILKNPNFSAKDLLRKFMSRIPKDKIQKDPITPKAHPPSRRNRPLMACR